MTIFRSSPEGLFGHNYIDNYLPFNAIGPLNGPVPLTLTAATWKIYSVFGVRPSMITLAATTDLFCCTSLIAPKVA